MKLAASFLFWFTTHIPDPQSPGKPVHLIGRGASAAILYFCEDESLVAGTFLLDLFGYETIGNDTFCLL